MTNNISTNSSESTSLVVTVPSKLAKSLLKIKTQTLSEGIIIPDELISNLEEFSFRNKIEEGYCERCLKAHAIKVAKEMGLNGTTRKAIENIFSCETGHNGYYMDEDKIVEITPLL